MTKHAENLRGATWVLTGVAAASGLLLVQCGFEGAQPSGSGGGVSNTTSASGNGTTAAGSTQTGAGGNNPTGSMAGQTSTAAGSANVSGNGTGGGGGGTAAVDPKVAKNYQVTGTFPKNPIAIPTAPGKLTYTKVEIHKRFLAESCAIGDYDKDGNPDISAGRRWYAGPFGPGMPIKEHIFRGGHDDLPNKGETPEIDTGVSDDWADGAYDVDSDGEMDIINIANCDVAENLNPNPKPAPQAKASAYWYKNPGAPANAAPESEWQKFPIHTDVRQEQHGLVDVDGDGFPEIYGACKSCAPGQTKGYYQADKANPQAGWTYHAVTKLYTFPFGGTGWLHGLGFGDVNGDGKSDLLERGGAWIAATGAAPNVTVCTKGAPQAGCGWYSEQFWDGDMKEERGGSHMYAADIDGDGDADVISADGAHHYGVSWYEQTAPGAFTKRQFVGSPADVAKYGVVFSEPHALEVADMDGDGAPDVITGKMKFAHPISFQDPDPLEPPVLYVFRTARNMPFAANGGSVTMQPKLVDMEVGVGRKLSVGHANTDGIMDICIASKLGLYVFLGQ